MGSEKKTTETQQDTSKTFEQTAAGKELTELELQRARANQAGTIQTQQSGLSLANQLLTGGQLPGQLGGLFGGITPELTREISQEAIADIQPTFQSRGLLDSGVNIAASAGVAGDIRRQVAESNLARKMQLLNLGFGGQAGVVNPALASQQGFGGQQAGLAGVNQTGFGTQTTTSMNPFLKSFQTSLGSSLGSGSFGATQFGSGFGR